MESLEECSLTLEKDQANPSIRHLILTKANKVFNHEELGHRCTGATFGVMIVKEAWSPDGTAEKDKKGKVTLQLRPLADLELMWKMCSGSDQSAAVGEGFSALQLRTAILETMEQLGGEKQEGPGPKEELPRVIERQLGQWLRA